MYFLSFHFLYLAPFVKLTWNTSGMCSEPLSPDCACFYQMVEGLSKSAVAQI